MDHYIQIKDKARYKDDNPIALASFISELEKDNESLNRELENSHKIIKSLRKRGKYKIGGLTDEEIEKISDQTRMQNGKINYTSMGKILGVSRETVQREIKKRKLTYLIDFPSS